MEDKILIANKEGHKENTLPRGNVFNAKEFLKQVIEIRELMIKQDPHVFERDSNQTAERSYIG